MVICAMEAASGNEAAARMSVEPEVGCKTQEVTCEENKDKQQLDYPFNQYNTEFVKLDANSWQESTINDSLITMSRDGIQRFVLLDPDDETNGSDLESLPIASYLGGQIMPPDSINNKSFTDVTFIVGPPQHSKKYVGHRVLLAMTSPVFETMFYGDMADKNKYIRIADVAPIGFENLLRYAYTDSLNLGSVEDAMLTAYAAKKYLLPQLLRECLTYIEHNISPATACLVFEFAHVLNSQQLVLQAMNLIDRQTSAVISSKSFSHVQASTVEFVANRKYLNLGQGAEFALFTALLNWTLAEVRRRQLAQGDWLVVRSILAQNSILAAIRFLAMSPEEFAKVVARSSETLGSGPRKSLAEVGGGATNESSGEQNGTGSQAALNSCLVEFSDSNSLLNDKEQRAVLLNLASPNLTRIPATLSPATVARQPPPEYFSLRRFRSATGSATTATTTTTTTTRSIKSITSKFQCLSENVFIVALTIPIRLDLSSYANRTPKFECHLKFTTKSTPSSSSQPLVLGAGSGQQTAAAQAAAAAAADQQAVAQVAAEQMNGTGSGPAAGGGLLNEGPAPLLMDTIDESLSISIARDKDCLVRLRRPILIRMGNINELTLTFQTYALDEDIVALQTPKLRSANFSEQTDGENISWLFFKTSNIEFSELHYYY